MAIKIVPHINMTLDNINYASQKKSLEVFCKKNHMVMSPSTEECKSCPYYGGFAGGYGHECYWEDVVPIEEDQVIVQWEDRYNELIRVSKLIDKGLITKG